MTFGCYTVRPRRLCYHLSVCLGQECLRYSGHVYPSPSWPLPDHPPYVLLVSHDPQDRPPRIGCWSRVTPEDSLPNRPTSSTSTPVSPLCPVQDPSSFTHTIRNPRLSSLNKTTERPFWHRRCLETTSLLVIITLSVTKVLTKISKGHIVEWLSRTVGIAVIGLNIYFYTEVSLFGGGSNVYPPSTTLPLETEMPWFRTRQMSHTGTHSKGETRDVPLELKIKIRSIKPR